VNHRERLDYVWSSARATGAALVHHAPDGQPYSDHCGLHVKLDASAAVEACGKRSPPSALRCAEGARKLILAPGALLSIHGSSIGGPNGLQAGVAAMRKAPTRPPQVAATSVPKYRLMYGSIISKPRSGAQGHVEGGFVRRVSQMDGWTCLDGQTDGWTSSRAR
jgi:hypothetical protein